MHERGIVQDLIDQAVQAAEGQQIKQIHVVLGEQCDVSEEALRFYFDELQPESMAAEAKLIVRTAPAQAECLDCGKHIEGDTLRIGICPTCGSYHLRMLSGDRLMLEALDVE